MFDLFKYIVKVLIDSFIMTMKRYWKNIKKIFKEEEADNSMQVYLHKEPDGQIQRLILPISSVIREGAPCFIALKGAEEMEVSKIKYIDPIEGYILIKDFNKDVTNDEVLMTPLYDGFQTYHIGEIVSWFKLEGKEVVFKAHIAKEYTFRILPDKSFEIIRIPI